MAYFAAAAFLLAIVPYTQAELLHGLCQWRVSMSSVAMDLQEALRLSRTGDFASAERLCRKVLRSTPTEPDALHLLGVLVRQVGRTAEAVLDFQPIRVDISPGELVDKISILQIKIERIREPAKLAHVRHELEALTAARHSSVPSSAALDALARDLRDLNEKLWDAEEALRECEQAQRFGEAFVELARSVYRLNDQRASVKRRINLLLNSLFVEEKSHLLK
jgi:tetratricopeptide (TPR) repeat protein